MKNPTHRFDTHYETHFANRVIRCFRQRPDSVQAMLQSALEHNPEGDAFVFQEQHVSYRALARQAARAAATLHGLGVRPGDRVALVLRNGPAFMHALFGALWLGAIAVPLNAREQGAGLALIFADCTPKVAIAEADLVERLHRGGATQGLAALFAAGGDAPGARPFEALFEGAAVDPPMALPDQEDTAVLLYTSGTTGRPKGAMLTHLNIAHTVKLWEKAMDLRFAERSVLAVPGSHVTGLMGIIFTMLHMAGCTLIMPRFDAAEFNQLVANENATSTIMVPAMYKLCLMRANFDVLDLSNWRVGAFGGAPMPESTILEFQERLPHLRLMNAYGATETSTAVTAMSPDHQLEHLDSIGRVLDCVDIRIMDEQGQECPAGVSGELWISGPVVIPGYWRDSERTAENFIGGYWRSGDIGDIGPDGYVRIFDRKKDMIIRGGYNIYCIEVENAIAYHPDVAECAVIGVPDPVLGEKILAVVCSRESNLDADTLRRFCADRLADYKVLDFVHLQAEPLPRNANGKVMKTTLRERLPHPETEPC
ncbi:class I adenylate-forming enzyme family protein [Alloalcanivorax marinus]|uniref:class I adenylate-forming enzyme family protein n=1 Tax=Alloalcanivorax marinus TaxID=1177169 RepID=UPI001931562D|nr:class I adenylate-forming enzyme family protein [Alloalcanivorax marinus]MBL7251822.1 acyl--CoA ligase [Alloalcanivorax marinus]